MRVKGTSTFSGICTLCVLTETALPFACYSASRAPVNMLFDNVLMF